MRTYGLSGSGMDVDQMVKDLMKARRARYDKVWQQKTQLEWKKQDYNSIYTLTESIRNTTLYDFKKQTNLSPKVVASTNDAVVSATANGQAVNIEHSITVSQMADGVKLTSSGNITPAGNYKGSLTEQFGIAAGTELDFTLNGKNIKFQVTDTTTLNDVVTSINQSGAGVKASYDATLDRFFLYSEKTGSAAAVNFTGTSSAGMDFLFDTLKLGNFSSGLSSVGMVSDKISSDDVNTATVADAFGVSGPLTFTVSKDGVPTSVTLDPADTLNDFMDQLNTTLGAGTASYDAASQRITIKAADINHAYSIDGADSASQAFLKDTLGFVQQVQNGHDAKFNIDGVDLTQSANTFTISGVTYTLKSVSLTNPDTSKLIPTTISVKPDIEKTIDAVQSFVDTYNAFITTINNELNEDRYRDFAPLTDEQKADMKDSEITAWESKAKSGSLRRDPILTSMLSNLRLSIVNPVKGLTGKYTSASSIGIETGKYVDDNGNITSEANNGGKLYVDEDVLRTALEEDPDAVFKIFGTSGDTAETRGVANRLYDQMYNSLGQLRTEAGYPNTVDTSSNAAKRLTDYSEQLTAMDRQLQMIQDRYYKQFDAMEAAISKLNQQSSWLSQQLGGN
jgi:flagellar hook-associated protein 2